MRKLLVFVEEPSSAVLVRQIGRIYGISGNLYVVEHQGAGHLERSLRIKLRVIDFIDTKIIILRDQDNYDCLILKSKMQNLLPNNVRPVTTIRIACRELESWYIAQPEALKSANVLRSDIPRSILRRNPDTIQDPKSEIVRRSHKQGQMWLANAIAPHLRLDDRRSASFRNFVAAFEDCVNWLRL